MQGITGDSQTAFKMCYPLQFATLISTEGDYPPITFTSTLDTTNNFYIYCTLTRIKSNMWQIICETKHKHNTIAKRAQEHASTTSTSSPVASPTNEPGICHSLTLPIPCNPYYDQCNWMVYSWKPLWWTHQGPYQSHHSESLGGRMHTQRHIL